MEYFLARAKGGTAALVTSYVAVCPPELGGIAMPGQLRLLNIGNQLYHGMDKIPEAMELFLKHDRTLIKPVIYNDR